jgi:hypothetical protein
VIERFGSFAFLFIIGVKQIAKMKVAIANVTD